jgi:hypothetical protein
LTVNWLEGTLALISIDQDTKARRLRSLKSADARLWTNAGNRLAVRALAMAAVPVLLVVAGCGGGTVSSGSTSNGTFTISPGSSSISIDTNCTGCNATGSSGTAVEQFTATLNAGGAAAVTWTATGGAATTARSPTRA